MAVTCRHTPKHCPIFEVNLSCKTIDGIKHVVIRRHMCGHVLELMRCNAEAYQNYESVRDAVDAMVKAYTHDALSTGSSIEWTDWNPVTTGIVRQHTARCHEDALAIPMQHGKPTMFVVRNLFHHDVPFEFIDQVFATMALCPQHTFQIHTEQTERMERAAEYLGQNGWKPAKGGPLRDRIEIAAGTIRPKWSDQDDYLHGPWPLPNVWLVTTVEDHAT